MKQNIRKHSALTTLLATCFLSLSFQLAASAGEGKSAAGQEQSATMQEQSAIVTATVEAPNEDDKKMPDEDGPDKKREPDDKEQSGKTAAKTGDKAETLLWTCLIVATGATAFKIKKIKHYSRRTG